MRSKFDNKKDEILNYLSSYIKKNGYPPAIREICEAVSISSTSTVHAYLDRLKKEGSLQKDPTKTRAMRIVDAKSTKEEDPYAEAVGEIVNVPVVGRVAAGMPILAEENIETVFPVPVTYTHNSDTFFLRVQGESMVNAGILDGDYVLIRKQNTANNAEKVVAMIEDEATVKTYYKEKDHIRLQPENDWMEPIIVERDVRILGIVIGVIRFF